MHKRAAFAYEHEVRAVVWREASAIFKGVPIEDIPSDDPPAIGIEWNVNLALDAIYISPYAEPWYERVVREVIAKFAPSLETRVEWSKMKGIPLYLTHYLTHQHADAGGISRRGWTQIA